MRKLLLITLILALLPVMAFPCGNCCETKCKPCCKQHTCTPACDTGCNAGCDTGCNAGCDMGCAMPCACMEWEPYCGCGMVTGLCISMQTDWCDGTAGPLKLLLRDGNYDDIVTIEMAGPVEGYYTMQYTFETPVSADSLVEAVLINDTDDPVTLSWLQVYGMFDYCGGWTYIDHTCPGAVIGPGGCPRMVLF